MSQSLLITGGGGFIGANAALYFSDRGYYVRVLDNLSRLELMDRDGSFTSNWDALAEREGIERVRGSIRDRELLEDLAEDADAILHTAGQTAVTTSMEDPDRDFELNALGTFRVLEAARRADSSPAVLHCSTNKVYGDNVNELETREEKSRYRFRDQQFRSGIDENFEIDHTGHSPYGCSKLAGDLYAQDYAETFGLKTGVFRMSCIYGPRQMGIEDQGWVAWFALATLLEEPITLYGDGKQVRDVLFVEDLLRCYRSFLEGPLQHGVWNVGGGPENTLSLLELLDLLEELTGNTPELTFGEPRPHDQKIYVSDLKRASSDLGWSPRVDPEEGIRRLLGWLEPRTEILERLVS